MAWTVERSAAADSDIDTIFQFLNAAALDLGGTPDREFSPATGRVRAIEGSLFCLGETPHPGTPTRELGEGLPRVTKERAVFHFETDEDARRHRVLAIFFGG